MSKASANYTNRYAQFLKMEKPGELKSIIEKSESSIKIQTPSHRSGALIFICILLLIQNGIGPLVVLTIGAIKGFAKMEMPLFMLPISMTIFFFALRQLLWQIRGKRVITIKNQELTIQRVGSYFFKSKTYDLTKVKGLKVIDHSVNQGPMAMLQLLKIVAKTTVTFTYGFDTIRLFTGIDSTEANLLKETVEEKLKSA